MFLQETWEDTKNSSINLEWDEQHAKELIKELKANYTYEKRNEVIEALLPLVVRRIEKKCNTEQISDDDREELYQHLCQIVMDCLKPHLVKKMDIKTSTNYINQAITNGIKNFIKDLRFKYSMEMTNIDSADGNFGYYKFNPKSIAIGNVWVEELVKYILDHDLISKRDLYMLLLYSGIIDGEEWSIKRLAEYFGVSKGAVDSTIRRRAKFLRDKLQKMKSEHD